MSDPRSLPIDAFRALFESSPDAYLVLTPDLRIVAVTQAYLRATSTRREDIVGRGLFEVFPDNPDDPSATGVANLRRSLERVLSDKRPDAMAIQKYDIRRPESEGGGFEERYWSPLNSPVLGADGAVTLIIHRVEDVTSRVRLEQQYERSDRDLRALASQGDRRFRALLETAPDAMVVVNERSIIDFVNVQAERLFGYTRAEMVGQRLEMLIPERARATHAQHVGRYLAHPDARPMGSGLELAGRRKDGTELPIEVSLSPLPMPEGIVVSAAIRDVSERKRAEADRRLAAERLASAVESIEEAFAIFDAEDRLLQCNSAYRILVAGVLPGQLVGRTHGEIVGAWAPRLVFADDASRARFLGDRSHRRAETAATIEVRTTDDRSLRIVERPTPEGGLVTLISDVTEDAQRMDELRSARRAADEGNAAKTEFLSSMSHELRTPLNAILGFAQLLQRDKKLPLDPRQEVRVTHILRGGTHLLRLIDDVLDLSRIESRNVSVSIEPVDLKRVLREVKTTVEPAATREGVEVEKMPAPRDLPPVLADQTRLTQILTNFASNAVKYNRRGGRVVFEITRPRPDWARVTVRDNGIGIPHEKQKLIFQPFQRAGQETGPIEGTGIGLAISKRLAELMHGTIGFTSVPGDGSVFWIELPLQPAAEVAAPAAMPVRAALPDAARDGGARLVLYVEDNPANVVFMEEFFSTLDDLELIVCGTAEDAIVVAKDRKPDVILMDINLPGMSGLDALRVLHGLPETASIPVIALTAAASTRDRERGEHAGFFRYLAKPIQLVELEAALASALGDTT